MSTTTISLAAEELRKEFGSVTALDGVDLSVEDPGILGVAGPNGSGKTTLIHCLLLYGCRTYRQHRSIKMIDGVSAICHSTPPFTTT